MSYGELLRNIDAWFARGVANAGLGVVLCRAGCSACCHGPFDISPADAELVATAVAALPLDVRESIRSRAEDQVAGYAVHAHGWGAPWSVDEIGDDPFDALGDALAAEPCPALDAAGSCQIYDSRPATCRMTGLPMATAENDVLENICPILETSAQYAALDPVLFALGEFEEQADGFDLRAEDRGWRRTTIAGAIVRQ